MVDRQDYIYAVYVYIHDGGHFAKNTRKKHISESICSYRKSHSPNVSIYSGGRELVKLSLFFGHTYIVN